jgi:formylglycine-generating enzyme required for sulfatase activity/glutaredoxin
MSIEFLEVPAGVVQLGSRENFVQAHINKYGQDWREFFSRELPQHAVEVAAFKLARTPVTNGQYRAFVDAGGYADRRWWTPAGWVWRAALHRTQSDYWRDDRFTGDDKPVVGVAWFEAYAFAKWAGGRLPSEAEWERAAKGDTDDFYPWGSKWEPHRLNSSSGKDHLHPSATLPVGMFSPLGDGPFRHQDLLGQVWEWCSSLFRSYPYHPGFRPGDLTAGEDPFDPGARVLRGGAWSDGRYTARNACRTLYPPGYTDINIGFRIAQDRVAPDPAPPAPPRELLIYGRSTFCSDMVKTKRHLFSLGVPYRQVDIDQDRQAALTLESLVHARSVPTAVITEPGGWLPIEPPAPIPEGQAARNFDRGTLVQEPDEATLARWIERHALR